MPTIMKMVRLCFPCCLSPDDAPLIDNNVTNPVLSEPTYEPAFQEFQRMIEALDLQSGPKQDAVLHEYAKFLRAQMREHVDEGDNLDFNEKLFNRKLAIHQHFSIPMAVLDRIECDENAMSTRVAEEIQYYREAIHDEEAAKAALKYRPTNHNLEVQRYDKGIQCCMTPSVSNTVVDPYAQQTQHLIFPPHAVESHGNLLPAHQNQRQMNAGLAFPLLAQPPGEPQFAIAHDAMFQQHRPSLHARRVRTHRVNHPVNVQPPVVPAALVDLPGPSRPPFNVDAPEFVPKTRQSNAQYEDADIEPAFKYNNGYNNDDIDD